MKNALHAGDLGRAEGMLIAQAHSLNEIFVNLARRSSTETCLKLWETYMRVALKAQGQCRMTLETLTAMKNPTMVFARQANISNGPQQVNNGMSATDLLTRAREDENEPTKLMDVRHGERMDTCSTSAPSGVDSALATVGAVNRSEERGR